MRREGRQGGRCSSSRLMQCLGWHAACFLRAYAGAPVTRTLRFLLASLRKSVRADTLRAHPENTARHLGWPSVRVEGRCRPKVTSGCPKRSEGGCPCRNEDEHQPLHAPSHSNANTASEPVSCRSYPAAHSREREPNAPRSAPPPESNQRQKRPQRCRCAPPARAPPNRQCR